MIPIITPARMREIDAAAADSIDTLIERAGRVLARRARLLLGGVYGRRVVAICGPGNNGADARVAARVLRQWGVRVIEVGPDAERLPAADLIIDGAFGTGTNRGYRPPQVPADTPVLAVDIPSGVDGLTGVVLDGALHATETVTFAALKPGLLLGRGRDRAGKIHVADIGLDTGEADSFLFTESDARAALPQRERHTHKWKRAVYVVGGSGGMFGAPLLASRAALRAGAGLVWCGLPGQKPPPIATEVVFRDLPLTGWADDVAPSADRFGALVVGPGLGEDPGVRAGVRELLDAAAESNTSMVIDGDGLRSLGSTPRLRANVVLTPHDGEFAALTGDAPGHDRFAAARELAAATGATVLLKGPLTIVASPSGQCLASSTGDQRLATAGSGDVLAGIIGSYLAAGLEPSTAAALGAWVHGAAAPDVPFGMVASDLVEGLPAVAARLTPGRPNQP